MKTAWFPASLKSPDCNEMCFFFKNQGQMSMVTDFLIVLLSRTVHVALLPSSTAEKEASSKPPLGPSCSDAGKGYGHPGGDLCDKS